MFVYRCVQYNHLWSGHSRSIYKFFVVVLFFCIRRYIKILKSTYGVQVYAFILLSVCIKIKQNISDRFKFQVVMFHFGVSIATDDDRMPISMLFSADHIQFIIFSFCFAEKIPSEGTRPFRLENQRKLFVKCCTFFFFF